MDKKDAMEAEMIDDINIATSETSNDVSTINRYSDSKFRIFSIDVKKASFKSDIFY